VLQAVVDGTVSAQAARSLYGVVLAETGRGFDETATSALRQTMRMKQAEQKGVREAAE